MRTLLILALTAAAVPAAAQQTALDCDEPRTGAAAEPGAAQVYLLRDVEVLPQVANTREFQQALARRYPADVRSGETSGWVNVCFIVEADGSISNPTVMRSTDRRFEQSTLEAVSVMRFRPARVGGRPVRVFVVQPIQWMVQRDVPEREARRDPRITNPEKDWRPTLSDRVYGPKRIHLPSPPLSDPPLPPPPPPLR
jgi:TonB family protein